LRTTRNDKDKAEKGHKGVKALARANKKAGARANKMAREEKGKGLFLPGQICLHERRGNTAHLACALTR
jgi:hypothetical protein